MASNEVFEQRSALVHGVFDKFLSQFAQTIGTEITLEDYLSIYSQDIEWYDHAFQIHRIGHDAVLGLHEAWSHCNKEFKSSEKKVQMTKEGGVLEQIWTGVCANDIVRPDGAIAVKASGKRYTCHVVMIMKISNSGLIERIDEYYNKQWDDGKHESEYPVIRGKSLKSTS